MSENLEPIAVSATEAAQLLGVSRPTLYKLLNSTGFPAFRCGGRVLISVEGLRKWVEAQISVEGGGCTSG